MNINLNKNEQDEFNKVINLLTPKHSPTSSKGANVSYNTRHRNILRFFKVSAVATICAVIATVGIAFKWSVRTEAIPASQIVEHSLADIAKAKGYKISFMLRGSKRNKDEIYTPNPNGDMIRGTLYIAVENNTPLTRIDWDDTERNTIIFSDGTYTHLQGYKIINSKKSLPLTTLYNLVSLNTLPSDLKDSSKTEIDESGDEITLTTKGTKGKEQIRFQATFSRSENRLKKASATALIGSEPIELLTTDSIDYSSVIPLNLFKVN